MNNFADNPDYVAYERLLLKLHRLSAEGKGDDDEAESVRDLMDEPWYRLSPEEDKRMRGLSADLYMLQDEEIHEPYEGTQEQLRSALSEALGRLDYEAFLSLLRKGPQFLKPAHIAGLRGRCYVALGHLEAGLLFMRYAEEHEPEQASHRLYILVLLVQLGRNQEVFSELAQINHIQEATSGADSYMHSLAESLLVAA